MPISWIKRVGAFVFMLAPLWLLAVILQIIARRGEGYRVVRKTIELWREQHRGRTPSKVQESRNKQKP
jgi:hypothetical protein